MTALITADLHLSDDPRTEYRWKLFPWLAKMIGQHDVDHVLILGDITDAKDKHQSRLVNRIMASLKHLLAASTKVELYLLRGNHDAIDFNVPFFGFTSDIPRIHFINEPTYKAILGESLFLPCTRNWEKDWDGIDFTACKRFIFTHQTYDGCITESGMKLSGIPPSVFKGSPAKVISGDIHPPQHVNKRIQYVGAPYRVHFGDDYTPRVLLVKNKHDMVDLIPDLPSRFLIEIGMNDKVDMSELRKGDQVKVRVRLTRTEFSKWPKIKEEIMAEAKEYGVEIIAVELKQEAMTHVMPVTMKGESMKPKDIVGQYGKKMKLPKELLALGIELVT